jgi:hypothetical protein
MPLNPNADTINCQGTVTDAQYVLKGNTTMSSTSSFNAIAPFIAVAWESSDLPSFTPVSAPLLQSATSTKSTLSTVTGTDAAHATSSNGLAEGTKIGLGFGIPCGLLICATAALFFYRRGLRRARLNLGIVRTAADQSVAGIVAKAELGGNSHVHEIGGKQVLAEADNMHVRHELDGN